MKNLVTGKTTKKLRSFVYLDNYKMYSISSQLFEGLTEYIVKSENTQTVSEESQKGPKDSGRILAEIIENNASQTEKKFLHDYSYNLFEQALIEQGRVLEINSENISDEISNVGDYSFIKISGNVIFNDLKIIEETIRNFNEIGGAFGYVTRKEEIDALKDLKNEANAITDRNQKAKALAMLKNKTDFKKMMIEAGLNMDDDFLKNLAYILDYGYNQQFEVQIPIKDEFLDYYMFSAQLKRENLKDSEQAIIKKYSRESEKKFQLFGILTQKLSSIDKAELSENLRRSTNNPGDSSMKEALMVMVTALTNVENTFTGKLNYEYVIDPIALYLEI